MAYTAQISRGNPTCFLFLLDQSASMSDRIGGGEVPQRKSDVVADSLNRLLSELSVKCAKEEGVRDYFHIGVIGYGATLGPALGGSLADRLLVPLSEVADSPTRLEERKKMVPDGAGGLVATTVQFPTWVEPRADGGTPMPQALELARTTLAGWLAEHPRCFPPVVLNLTDGESSEGDPSPAAEAVRELSSEDGRVLLFNLHVSSDRSAPVAFPDTEVGLPDPYARTLFAMSSLLPGHMRTFAEQQGYRVSEATRGFVFNADVTAVVQFLDIGTQAGDVR